MPSRVFPFVNGHYYHVYNRGSEKRQIFDTNWDYLRFLKTVKYYQLSEPKPRLSKFLINQNFKIDHLEKIIDIICYCLMPNHFHFLVRQVKEDGITKFTGQLSNSYTKYYNTKYRRVGPLLQGEFKAVLIESDEQLIHVSRYIHLNPLVSLLTKDLNLYRWSSYHEYVNKLAGICDKDPILGFFKSPSEYNEFILDHAGYATELELIKHQLLDEH